MTLNIPDHRTILFQILKDIYSDTTLAPYLGFKGGTAALLFYGLDRFSVDLDFDLLADDEEDRVFIRIGQIIEKYGQIKESYQKRFNLFYLLSYRKGEQQIKVEINRRQFGSSYEIKTLLGVSMLVMVQPDMFAHKLVAMSERLSKTSRDLYDVWYFLTKNFLLNEDIVTARTNLILKQLVTNCIDQIEKIPDRSILTGLGELLNPSQKDWARTKLKGETISLLTIRFLT